MQEQPLVEERVVELGDATSVKASVGMGSGNLRIAGGGDRLMRGRFEYGALRWKPEVQYAVEDGRGSLRVKQPDERIGLDVDPAYLWDLAFADEVPLDLDISLGAGQSALDLGSTTLRTLHSAIGSGQFAADLTGGLSSLSDVVLNVASGRTSLVMSGAYPVLENVRVAVASGLLDLALDGQYEELHRLVVRSASGDVRLGLTGSYPALEQLRVDTASGTVDLNFGGALDHNLTAKITCVSGRVVVRYPPEAGVSARFTSVTGSVQAPEFRREGRRYLNGAFGESSTGLELVVSSVSGTLILQPSET
jgi:hypothetical protein